MDEETINKNSLKIRYTRKKLLEIGEKQICKKIPDSFKGFYKNLTEHSSISLNNKQKFLQPHEWMVNTAYDTVMMYQPPLMEHKMYMHNFQTGGTHSQKYQEHDYFPQRQTFVASCGINPDFHPTACKRNKSSFWPNRFPSQHYQNKYFETNQNDSTHKNDSQIKKQNEDVYEHTYVDHNGNEKATSSKFSTLNHKDIETKYDDRENVNHKKESEDSLRDNSKEDKENTIARKFEKQWFSEYDHVPAAKDFVENIETNCKSTENVLSQTPNKEFKSDSTTNTATSFSTSKFGKYGKGDGGKKKETDENFTAASLSFTTKEYFNSTTKKQISLSNVNQSAGCKVNSFAGECDNASSDVTNIMSTLRIRSECHSGQGDSPSTCFMAEKNMCYIPQAKSSEVLKQHFTKSSSSNFDSKLPSNYTNIHTPEAKDESLSELSTETKQKKSPREIFPDLTQLQPEQKMDVAAKTKSMPKMINPMALLMQLPYDIQMLVKTAKPTSEMMGRTEAIAILSGLKNGQMTLDHLARQLQNSALQQRHKELLACILKMCMQDPLLTRKTGPEAIVAGGTQNHDGSVSQPKVTLVLAKMPEQLTPAYCQLMQSPQTSLIYPASQLLVGPRPAMPLPARIVHKNHAAHLLQKQLRQLGTTQHTRSFGAEELDNYNLQPAPEDLK